MLVLLCDVHMSHLDLIKMQILMGRSGALDSAFLTRSQVVPAPLA